MTVWLPIIVPAGVAGVCLLVSWRAWRRRSLRANGHWGGAVAFAGGFFAAHVLLLSWPDFPPGQSAEWLAWLAIPLGVVGVLQRWWGGRWYTAWPVRIFVSAGVCYALLQAKIDNDWSRTDTYAWLGGLTVAFSGLWYSLETLAAMRGGASLPLSLWTWCAVSAGAFTLAGSAAIGQLAGALAAAWGAAIVLAWWAPGLSVSGGVMTAFVPLYAGLLLRSHFFSELTIWSAGLLYAAPFVLWYGEQRRFRFTRPWKAALVRMGLIAVPALMALGIEWWLKARGQELY